MRAGSTNAVLVQRFLQHRIPIRGPMQPESPANTRNAQGILEPAELARGGSGRCECAWSLALGLGFTPATDAFAEEMDELSSGRSPNISSSAAAWTASPPAESTPQPRKSCAHSV
jgi:hypothetical protein